MIPKVIHYCWFGHNPLPPLALKCIESWKKYLPDYEIKEWNEDNFDVNMISYTQEAYAAKKYAFVSDYARFWILYHYGGLYFDTDVEIIRNMDDIIARGPFMGQELCLSNQCHQEAVVPSLNVNPGLGLGASPGLGLYKKILDKYTTLHFVVDGVLNETTIVKYTSDLLNEYPLKKHAEGIDCIESVYIYLPEYFCPIDYQSGKKVITSNTVSIHHFASSWKSNTDLLKFKIIRFLGEDLTQKIVAIKKKLLRH